MRVDLPDKYPFKSPSIGELAGLACLCSLVPRLHSMVPCYVVSFPGSTLWYHVMWSRYPAPLRGTMFCVVESGNETRLADHLFGQATTADFLLDTVCGLLCEYHTLVTWLSHGRHLQDSKVYNPYFNSSVCV